MLPQRINGNLLQAWMHKINKSVVTYMYIIEVYREIRPLQTTPLPYRMMWVGSILEAVKKNTSWKGNGGQNVQRSSGILLNCCAGINITVTRA